MSRKKEVMFAEALEQLRTMAREQGNCVSEGQVREKLAEL